MGVVSKKPDFRPGDVKRYKVDGVTYTYHRASGTRLPDLDFNDPAFISALETARFNASCQTEAQARWGNLAGFEEVPIEKIRSSITPDVVAFIFPQLVRFVQAAKAGHVLLYYSGDLATDSARNPDIKDRARYISIVHDFGLVQLRQARVAAGWSHYFAIRTDEAIRGTPEHIVRGRITPEEYLALVAINERQASISVSRAIRDHLGTSDDDASQIRNSMIRRGWLTNTRPPELTPLGLSLLA